MANLEKNPVTSAPTRPGTKGLMSEYGYLTLVH